MSTLTGFFKGSGTHLGVFCPNDYLIAVFPVIEAARILRDAKIGALLVSGEDGRYIGVLSETDLVRKVLAAERDASRVLVSEVMMAPIITIEIDRSAHDASDLMAERAIRHLAVTEDGHIVGMLSVRDLLRYFKNWGRL